MKKEDYQVIREATKPLQMLGNLSNEEEVRKVALLYQAADESYSINLLLKALQATFQRDLDSEQGGR